MSEWKELYADDGNVYYENSITGASQWEKPAGFDDVPPPPSPRDTEDSIPPPPASSISSTPGPPSGRFVAFSASTIGAPSPPDAADDDDSFNGSDDSFNDDSVMDNDMDNEPAVQMNAIYSKTKSSGIAGAAPPPPPPAPADHKKKRQSKKGHRHGKKRNARELAMDFDEHVKPGQATILYANFLAGHPCMCFCISGFLMLTFASIGFVLREDRPDFNKADKGFEPRGTVIGGKMKAYERHLQDAQCEGDISTFPNGVRTWHRWANNQDDDDANHEDWDGDGSRPEPKYCSIDYYNQTGKIKNRRLGTVEQSDFGLHDLDYDSPLAVGGFMDFMEADFSSASSSLPRTLSGKRPELFCSSVNRYVSDSEQMQIVLESTGDLLTLPVLQQVCKLDEQIRDRVDFNPFYCITKMNFNTSEYECCKSRSIPNYVAQLANKASCLEITEPDVQSFKQLLANCSSAYHESDTLTSCEDDDVEDPDCRNKVGVPAECWNGNMAYDVFNALAHHEYKDPAGQPLTAMKLAVTGDPGAKWLMDLYKEVFEEGYDVGAAGVKVVGIDFNIKFELFNEQLITDGALAGAAFFSIYILMWLQTGSLFVTTLAYIEILSALGVAYFIYMCVMWLPFFPFLNLVGVFIVIGIGADDVFVFMDAWKQSEVMMTGDNAKKIHLRMAWVLKRAGGAMLVTSMTTSFAFFASAVSNITGLKCFGIYTGIVVLADFFLMITYLPSVVLLNHIYIEPFFKGKCETLPCCKAKKADELGLGEKLFEEKIHPVLFKGRWAWILLFGGIGGFFTYAAQGLPRPKTGDFQLFHGGHIMEEYEMKYQMYFNQGGLAGAGGARAFFPVSFVWGLDPIDTGDWMDPSDFGDPQWVDIKISKQASQEWLIDFCEEVREQSWYLEVTKETAKYEKCFMETFRDWVTIPCNQTDNNPDPTQPGWERLAPRRAEECCGYDATGETEPSWPMTENKFGPCLNKYAMKYGDTDPGAWFDIDRSGEVKALVVSFVSNVPFTNKFAESDALYKELSAFESRIACDPLKDTGCIGGGAPLGTGLRGGFMVSEMSFYDLQSSIGAGAFQSMVASTIMAFVVLLFTTQNIVIVLYSCLAIVLITGTCVGILVLDGWELNILESIIFSVAVGMAVDFVAHYSHAYLHAPVVQGEEMSAREQKVKSSLTVMGVSVTSAAFTTFIAGAIMCFSETLFFYKFGVFMTLVMSVSWLFSTFFLGALLGGAGPIGNVGDLCFWRKKKGSGGEGDGTDMLEDMQIEAKMTQQEKMASKFQAEDFEDPSKFNSARK